MALTKITTDVITGDSITSSLVGAEFTTSQSPLIPTGTKDVEIYSTATSNEALYFLGANSGQPGLIEVEYQPGNLIPAGASLVGKYLKILGTSNLGSIVPGTYAITVAAFDAVYGEAQITLGSNQQQAVGGYISPPINLEFYERFPVYDVDWTSAQIFIEYLTSSIILNVTNPVIGISKSIIAIGSGNSSTITLNVGGAAGTFNLISGAYDDTSGVKNLYSIMCVSATEFWYSISQIAT